MPDTGHIILIAEGTSDPRVAQGFLTRAIQELDAFVDLSWIVWRGLEAGTDFLPWHRAKSLAKERRIQIRGRFRDADGLMIENTDEKAVDVRRALNLCDFFFQEVGKPLAVLMFFDSDGKPERLDGAKQARTDHAHSRPEYEVILGMAHPCREAWLVCAFQAEHEAEKNLLETLQKELSFHPCREPERLNTAREHPRNAKTVLSRLTSESLEREQAILEKADFAHLQTHGKDCGLADFLEEVKEKLAPLLGVKHDRP